MRLQGYYDAMQDRILLRLWNVPSGDTALWLTRRQWLAIALACYRVRSATARQGGHSVRPRRNTAAAGKDQMSGYGSGRAESFKSPLVSTVKFRRTPFGLRIEIAAEASVPLDLTLKGENLSFFIGLVERLAARAKWDLPAALSRMDRPVTAQKRVLS